MITDNIYIFLEKLNVLTFFKLTTLPGIASFVLYSLVQLAVISCVLQKTLIFSKYRKKPS